MACDWCDKCLLFYVRVYIGSQDVTHNTWFAVYISMQAQLLSGREIVVCARNLYK